MIELIDFDKDEAAQDLLGCAGITEPYEHLISRASLNILRQSVPDTEIETIRYVRPVSRHPGLRVGGTPVAEDSSKIRLQDMTMPFDLEITVRSGHDRHRLRTTFTIHCRKIDETPENEDRLEIHEQTGL